MKLIGSERKRDMKIVGVLVGKRKGIGRRGKGTTQVNMIKTHIYPYENMFYYV